MQQRLLEDVQTTILSGVGSDGLIQLLQSAIRLSEADSAFLAVHKDGRIQPLANYGMPIRLAAGWQVEKAHEDLFRRSFLSSDAVNELGLTQTEAHWPYIINVPLRLGRMNGYISLTCVGHSAPESYGPRLLSLIEQVAESCSFHLHLLSQLAGKQHSLEPAPVSVAEPVSHYHHGGSPEDSAITAEFLTKTLILRRRLATRNGVSFTTTRTWRTGIKDWQLVALKALKRRPPEHMIDQIAQELLASANEIGGAGCFSAVTSVACGHSGPGCLAGLIGRRVAAHANLPYVQMFKDMCLPGSSHPKTNAKRPPPELISNVRERFLLVDDVATSGAHMAEAATLIRNSGSSVLPIAWIGA